MKGYNEEKNEGVFAMIYDVIENLSLYPGFEEIKKFVETTDVTSVPTGRYDLADGIFANISEYAPAEGGLPEAHRDYADLQYMVSGREIIEVFPLKYAEKSTGYKPDIEFFEECSIRKTPLVLEEGTFAYFAPADVHRPCIKDGCDSVRKIVFKIPLSK